MIINQIHIHSILIDVNLLFWILHSSFGHSKKKKEGEREILVVL